MLSISILFKAFLSILILFSGSFFCGQFIVTRRIYTRGLQIQSLFEYVLIGLLLCTSVYAMVQTGFRTILLPVPFVLFAFYYDKEKPKAFSNLVSTRSLLLVLLAVSVFYLAYYCQSFIGFNNHVYKYSSGDISFYARLGDYLNELGRENSSIDYLYPSRFTAEPYHYWDIWLGAMTTRLSGLNPHFAKVLVVYPFLSLLFSLGVFLLGLRFCSRKNAMVYVVFLAALFSGLVFLFPYSLFKTDVYALSPTYYGKTLIVGAFIVFLLFTIIEKNWKRLIPAVAIAAIGYVNIAPTIFIALALFLVYLLWKKEVTIKQVLPSGIVAALLLLYFVWFYKGSSGNVQSSIEYSAKTSASIFIGGLFQFFIILPFVWLLWMARKLSFKKISIPDYVVFFLLLPLSGLLSWALLWNRTNEAVQFFFVVFIPFCAVSIALIICVLLDSRDRLYKFTGIFYLLLVLVQNLRYDANVESVSRNDFNSLKNFVSAHGTGDFVNLRNENEFSSFFSRSTMVYRPLNWYSYIDRNYQNYSLNAPYIPIDPSEKYAMVSKSLIDRAPFSYYVHQHPEGEKNLEEKFIVDKGIKYLTLSPEAAYPENLSHLFHDSLRLETGWRVYDLTRESYGLLRASNSRR